MPKTTCVEDACSRTDLTRGLCGRHYQRRRKLGIPLPVNPPAPCPQCAELFTPATAAQKFCSRPCQANYNRDRDDRPPCAEPDCARPIRAKGLCNTHYNATYFPDARQRWPASPEAKAKAWRTSTAMRRARIRKANREPVDRDVVAGRDGWICGICDTAVDPSAKYPDPMSASLDHIEPLSLGGDHTYANTRIAHLTCNVRRSNRVA